MLFALEADSATRSAGISVCICLFSAFCILQDRSSCALSLQESRQQTHGWALLEHRCGLRSNASLTHCELLEACAEPDKYPACSAVSCQILLGRQEFLCVDTFKMQALFASTSGTQSAMTVLNVPYLPEDHFTQ